MAMNTGQTLNDRLNAARYALAGQGLARVVCKATTEEVIGPKKKHLEYLLQCTHEPNVSIPQLANLLIERTNHSSWVVVFKALVTVHHLMCYGNERFTQYLASSNCNFQLSNFLDKNGVKGYEMSTFIRRYAKYINEKALSYRTVAFDFTKIKRGKEDGSLRSMNSDKLLKTIPILQSQVDSLLEFDCNANDLTNGVINAAFMLLFRDLIRLFACYNDGIINCLEKFFDMNKKHAREALDIYKKFLIRMDKVAEFLKTAENVGIDKGEIPDLTKAPSSLLDVLEQHLAQLEGRKGQAAKNSSNGAANGSAIDGAVNGASAVVAAAAAAAAKEDPSVKKALEEEELMMKKLRERHIQEKAKKPNNPFLASPTSESKSPSGGPAGNQGILDLFSESASTATNSSSSAPTAANSQPNKASDDLLGLSAVNPFAEILNAANASSSATSFGQAPTSFQQPPAAGTTPFNNGNSGSGFATDAGFAAAFRTETNATSSSTEGGQKENREIDRQAAEEKAEKSASQDQSVDKLPVPAVEEQANRSISPSPTHDIPMRGAGTTPILTNEEHEENCGEDASGSRGNTPSPAKIITAPPPSGETSPAPAFDQPAFNDAVKTAIATEKIKTPPNRPPPPQDTSPGSEPPVRPPPPAATSPSQEPDFFEDESQPPPRPPMPQNFAAFDPAIQQQILIQQHLAYQQLLAAQQAQMQQQQQKKPPSAFEDLDLAMRQTMAKPEKPVGQSGEQAEGQPQLTPAQMQQLQGMMMMPQGYMMFPGGFVAGFDAFGDVLQPQLLNKAATQQPAASNNGSNAQSSLIKGDLDSSLASLAQNLDINGPKGGFKKPGQQQFASPKNTVKTGAPPISAATTAAWPAGQPMTWNAASGAVPMVGQPMMPGAAGQWPAGAGPMPQMMMPGNTMPMMGQGFGMQIRPGMVMPGAVPGMVPGANMMTSGQTKPANQSDPFGAL